MILDYNYKFIIFLLHALKKCHFEIKRKMADFITEIIKQIILTCKSIMND